jgi:hypothetical protein
MQLTLEELKERLKTVPEVDLLELLDITAEDLVTQFSERIEDNQEILNNEVQWEDDE